MNRRVLRTTGIVASIAVLAIAVSGCLAIKSETAFQRAAGVVTLGGTVCASDHDSSTYSTCNNSNVAETDNGLDADGTTPGNGQILVAFRVPNGTVAPGSFLNDTSDVSFSQSPTYLAGIQADDPAAAGEHWVAYISTPKFFDSSVSADRQTSFHPEFALPAQAGGAPDAGPLPWRMVVGLRQLTNTSDAGDPVDCSNSGPHFTICEDSPSANLTTDLHAPISDYGVLSGAAVTTPQTRTATVAFPVRYLDGGGLGTQVLAISASTTAPGGSATPSITTLNAAPNSTTTVNVAVPVPLSTPVGSYTVRLTATTGSPAITRTSTRTLVVAPAPDTDHDGIADPLDKCPTSPRGQFDSDHDGCPGPYKAITSNPTGTWSVSNAGVRIGSMHLPSLPKGAKVKLSCKACHVKQTLTAKSSTLTLKKLANKLLRRGKSFSVTITAFGFIGRQVTLTVKKFGHKHKDLVKAARKPFSTKQECIPVGSTKPAKTCDATPPTGP